MLSDELAAAAPPNPKNDTTALEPTQRVYPISGDYADNGLFNLSENDRATLETESKISRNVITARGYDTIRDKHELPRYGHAERNAAIPCLLIPLHSADGKTIVYQIRPNTTPEGSGKYFLPSGGRLVVDCNPIARADVLNPDVELWLSEGAKKADSAISHDLPCVSISGVSCWRDKNGPLPCWEYIPLKGRSVVLAFDSDFRTNPRVYRALQRLANWLRSKGATVRYCLLPEGKDGAKVGLDDFFAQGGSVPQLRELLADELPPLSLDAKLALLDTTDTGNAERLAARFGEDLRYCHTWKTWLVWNGKYWKRDETGQAMEQAKKTARAILGEAAATTDDEQRTALVAWSKRTQSRDRLQAMLSLAQSLPGIGAIAEEFDSDEWLLNVGNGTINLQTGTLREPERDDLITRILPVEYSPTVPCPTWLAFLEKVLPDADVRDFIKRATGYSLTGSVRDHVLFFLYGQGRNGKSTFLNIIYKLLMGYACRLRADVLMQDRNGPNKNATPELAALRSVRFAAVSELNDGQKMDEGLIKSLTGGDPVPARELYQKPETFLPSHKLWLAGNHRPVIKGNDEGIWTRPKLIPFTIIIPKEQRDAKLPEKLEAELPGILAWSVQGCLEWQRDGLKPPATVEAATQEYREEMDVLAPFLEDSCVCHSKAKVTKGELWKAYVKWTETNGEQAHRTQRTFNPTIKRMQGITEGTSGHNGAKTWFGIGLKVDSPDTENRGDADPLTEQTENAETFPYEPLAYGKFSGNQSAQSAQSANSPLRLKVTASIRQTAQILAEKRTRAHDGNRAASECHGDDAQNLRYDFFGLLAETALTDALERHGLKPEGYQFLTERAPSEPDFSLCGFRFDVKACLPGRVPGKSFVSVNAGKHETPETQPDFYALCLFDSEEEFTVALVPASDVDHWKRRDGVEKADGTRRKPYYSIDRDALTPITTLEAFALLKPQEGKKWEL